MLLLSLLFSIPPFKQLGNRLALVSSDFVTLRSLVPPEPATAAQKADEQARRPRAWKESVLAALSLAEAAAWTGITGWKTLQLVDKNGVTLRDALLSVGMVVVWVSCTVLRMSRRFTSILTPSRAVAWDLFDFCLSASHHPPWSVLIAAILLFVVSAWTVGQAWYIQTITGFLPSWASSGRIALELVNAGATAGIILVLGSLKLASPEVLSRLVRSPCLQ